VYYPDCVTTVITKGTAMTMIGLAAWLLAADARNTVQSPGSWDKKAASTYLDEREAWWMNWPKAARDHGTFCVSCHTAVPYAISRPALRTVLGEQTATVNEQRLIDSVTMRVRLWKEVEPWYSDERVGVHKTGESRGTESVLNAFILSNRDTLTGTLSADTRLAFATCGLRSNKQATKRGLGLGFSLTINPGRRRTHSTTEPRLPLSQLGQRRKIIGQAPRSKPISTTFANIFIATLPNELSSTE